MEIALACFLTQWRAFILRSQIREVAPSLADLVEEYDRCVAFVESVHPGFVVYLSQGGVGLFNPVDVNLIPIDLMESDDEDDDDAEMRGDGGFPSAGESSGETGVAVSERDRARRVILDVEDVIDLTLD